MEKPTVRGSDSVGETVQAVRRIKNVSQCMPFGGITIFHLGLGHPILLEPGNWLTQPSARCKGEEQS